MRGKGVSFAYAEALAGITPAYAGKSLAVTAEAIGYEDHPRLCGEKCFRMGRGTRCTGSPPPMRGKAQCSRVRL